MRSRAASLIFVLFCVLILNSPARAFDPLATSNSYDYVVLTNDNFAAQAASFLTLHPTLRSCLVRLSEVQAAFPGGTTVDQIRAFTAYAYQNWKVAPTYLLLVGDADMNEPAYDFIPSLDAENPYYNWGGVDWYANDGYFVAPVVTGQKKPIMHVGRIPARTAAQVTTAYTKTNAYQLIAGTPSWLQKILLLVGDAKINEFPGDPPNATYRTLNDQLKSTELNTWNQSLIATYYAQDYINYSDDAKTQVTRNAWNAGYGFVNALGNTLDIDWLVFMAYWNLPGYNGGTGSPTFTGSLASTGYLPVVFGNTCFTNWFHRRLQLSIGEDLLLTDPNKGAVAVIAPTHQVDMVEAYAMDQTFVHGMVKDGVRNIGRLYSTAKSTFVTQNQGHAVFADEFALLGDPALDIKLGPLPTPTAYASGMEIEDAPIIQDTPVSRTADIGSDNLRVVNQADGVSPLVGERMLQVKAHDALGTQGAIEWKIQDLSLPITQNMILSFWINLQSSPSGNGKVVIDGNTSLGRIKDRVDIFDQSGVRLDAKLRTGTAPGWQFYYADLSPLRGATLQDLRVRYESTSAADSGSLVAYFDDVRVKRYESEASQELVNHSCEEDEDGNGTPDFWTDLNGVPTTLNAQRSAEFKYDGSYSLLVQDLYANGGGAREVFTANVEAWSDIISLKCYAASPTTFRVRVRDLEAGTTVFEDTRNATNSWQTVGETITNPYAGVRPARFSLDILPNDPSIPVYVDAIEMYPPVVVSVNNRPSIQSAEPAITAVAPNPMRPGGNMRVSFLLPRDAEVGFAVFDAGGRRLAAIPARRSGAGTHWVELPPLRSVPAGLCFVRMQVNGAWMPGGRKTVVVR